MATLLADEIGMEAAADQLGHTSSELTRRHYVRRKYVTGDVRHVLDPGEHRKTAPSAMPERPSTLLLLVELGRIELPTYSMRTSRATNCAIAPGDHCVISRRSL